MQQRQALIRRIFALVIIALLGGMALPARMGAEQRNASITPPLVSGATLAPPLPHNISGSSDQSDRLRIFLPIVFRTDNTTSQTVISDQGGQLQSPDGHVVVTVPPGAVGAPTVFRYVADKQPVRASGKRTIQSFTLDAWRATDNSPVRTFNSTLTIRIQSVNVNLGAGEHLTLVTRHPSVWTSLPTTFDITSGTVTALTDRFSPFALVVAADVPGAVQLAPAFPRSPSVLPLPHKFYDPPVIEYEYVDGPITLSSSPDGSGVLCTDDAVDILITHPDGSEAKFHETCAIGQSAQPPQNVTTLFQPGTNKVKITLTDFNKPIYSSLGYWLVPRLPGIPPEVSIVGTWSDGQGNLAVKARATDDTGLASVVLESSDGVVPNPNMSLWPADGPDIYAGTIRNVPPNKKIHFTVTATDIDDLSTTVDQDNRVTYSSAWGSWCPPRCKVGNPIDTATGNDTDNYVDLAIPARGGTQIEIVRSVNSQNEGDGPFGHGSSFNYGMKLEFVNNPLLQGIQVRYDDGHTANFSDAGGGRYLPASPGNFDTITKDGSAYILRLKDRTSYHFDATGRLSEIRDRNDVPIALGYDAAGYLGTITDDAGRSVEVRWESDHIVEIRAPEGKALRYTYDGDRLRFFTDANGNLTEYRYDTVGRVIMILKPGGYTVQQAFDDRGRALWQLIGTTKRLDFSYDDTTRTTVVTNSYGYQTTYIYDERYFIAAVTDARQNTAYSTYDERGNLRRFTDRRGATWTYDYDSRGNRTARTDPLAGCSAAPYSSDVTRWVYDANDQIISTTDALNHTWIYEYDTHSNLIRALAPDGGETRVTYDVWGQPISITDPNGHTTRYAYDIYGNLVSTVDPDSNLARSAYDMLSRETAHTDANNHTVLFQYDGNDNIISIGDPKGRMSSYAYNGNDLLTRAVDRRGSERLYRYDQNLNLVAERDRLAGNWIYHGYDRLYRQDVLTDTLGYATHYGYDAVDQLSSVMDPTGATTQFGYDPNNNQTSILNALNQRTRMEYDAANRLHIQTDAATGRTEFCYDAEDRLISTIGPRGEITSYSYDPLGRLGAITDPLGQVISSTYDKAGNRTAMTDQLGYQTDYDYDRLNRLITIARPSLPGGLRPTTRFTYDLVGNLATITSPRSFVTHFAYDENGNLAAVVDPLGGRTSYTYDEEDNPLSFTDPNNHTITTTYNSVGLPIEVRDAKGGATRLEYDPAHHPIRLIDALGRPTTYEYDRRGQLVRAADPLGNATLYQRDPLGRVSAMADANGNITRYAYDPVGRLAGVTDALGGITSYDYDLSGNLTTIADANQHTTRFGYDLRAQVISETNALDNTWRYAYDPAGRLTKRVDALNRPTFYDYDSNNRLTGMTYGPPQNQPPILFAYDLDGNQTRMCDGLGCTSHTYDPLGRRTSTTDWLGRIVAHAYDSAGNMTGMTYPNGKAVAYAYDANNWLASLTDPRGATSTYEHNPLGQVMRILRPNSTISSFSYDNANRLTGIDNRKLGAQRPQSAYTYALDKVGNRTQVTETRAAFDGSNATVALAHFYQYDALNRLARAATAAPASATTYDFDAVGNRLSKSGTILAPDPGLPKLPVAPRPEQTSYSYNAANQLLTAGGSAFAYNANGDRTREMKTLPNGKTETADYSYDREDRLVSVRTTVASVVTMDARYEYDGYGRRARKTVSYPGKPVQVTTYLYDGLDIVGTKIQTGSKTSETYYYLASSPMTGMRRPVEMEQLGSGKRYWFQSDGLDSVVALTDEQGSLVNPLLYDEYGQQLAGKSDLSLFTYTAQNYDAETGLLHFYARYYDPARGMWMTQDPYRGRLDAPATIHRYGYVGANPIVFVDKQGYSTPDTLLHVKTYFQQAPKDPLDGYSIDYGKLMEVLYRRGWDSIINDANTPATNNKDVVDTVLGLGLAQIRDQEFDSTLREIVVKDTKWSKTDFIINEYRRQVFIDQTTRMLSFPTTLYWMYIGYLRSGDKRFTKERDFVEFIILPDLEKALKQEYATRYVNTTDNLVKRIRPVNSCDPALQEMSRIDLREDEIAGSSAQLRMQSHQ